MISSQHVQKKIFNVIFSCHMTRANKRNPYLFVSILVFYKIAIQNLHIKALVWVKKKKIYFAFQTNCTCWIIKLKKKTLLDNWSSVGHYTQETLLFSNLFPMCIFTFMSHGNLEYRELRNGALFTNKGC